MTKQTITVASSAHLRLDAFLSRYFFERGLSRNYWNNMIKAGYVEINNELAHKSGTKVKQNDEISIDWPPITDEYSDKVRIIYQDSDVLVINKPAGMLTHSKGAFNPEFTVADFVTRHADWPENAGNRNGIVHRLDRQTSGVLICAKNQEALQYLQKQFAERQTQKLYIAVVSGKPIIEEITVDIPLQRDHKNPKKQAVSEHGRVARTHVIPLSSGKKQVVALYPQTGRTHQLRVHLAHIGSPIIGDRLYGSDTDLGGRFLLHAYKLRISLAPELHKVFVADLPEDMASYIDHGVTKAITELKF